MKFSTSFVYLATLLGAIQAHTLDRRDGATIDDPTVLNYALTLEHLENAFYHEALGKFDNDAFIKSGLPPWARGRFEQIAAHESAHVDFLSSALGDKATQPCTYKFPYTDPKSFTALSSVLEGVGVSAYAGAAQYISNKDYLTAAAVVLSTEARHASWVSSAVNKQNGWSGALDTPLGLSVVYTLAAQFIESCPSSNPTLPVKAFPSLTLASPKPGQFADVTAASGVETEGKYVAFFSGLATTFVEVQNGKVMVPKDLTGTAYAVLTNSDSDASDESIQAGVAVVALPFDSNGKPEY